MITYRLVSQLNQDALIKMEESIIPLIGLISEFLEESNSVEEFLCRISKDIPFKIQTWVNNFFIPKGEIWISLSSYCLMVIEAKSIYRDYQLKKILN